MTKRTSRPKRRTSRNPLAKTPAARGRFVKSRTEKLKKLEHVVNQKLFALRHLHAGPDLTIEEERTLDSIALGVAQTREDLGQMPLNKGLLNRVRKALGYTY